MGLSTYCATRQSHAGDVAFGSASTELACRQHVRFTPRNGPQGHGQIPVAHHIYFSVPEPAYVREVGGELAIEFTEASSWCLGLRSAAASRRGTSQAGNSADSGKGNAKLEHGQRCLRPAGDCSLWTEFVAESKADFVLGHLVNRSTRRRQKDVQIIRIAIPADVPVFHTR